MGSWQDTIDDLERQVSQLTKENERLKLSCQDCPTFLQQDEMIERLTAENSQLRKQRKRDCVEFFQWWWNRTGSNTEQGYDEWVATQGRKSCCDSPDPFRPEDTDRVQFGEYLQCRSCHAVLHPDHSVFIKPPKLEDSGELSTSCFTGRAEDE